MLRNHSDVTPDLAIFVANDRLTKPIPLPLAHTRILHGGSVFGSVHVYIRTLEVIAGVRT